MKKIIFYNLTIFFILFLLTEIITGTILFNKIDCNYLLCNQSYTYKNEFGFYKDKKNIYQRDQFGFRGKKNSSNIDILTIGGSTTDERYLNEKDTWSELLEYNFFKDGIIIDVVNAGIDGQSTIGHIWNFKNWFPKIKNFKPTYIIFYIGLNERLNSKEISRYDNNINASDTNIKRKIIDILKKNNGIAYRLFKVFYKKYFYKETIDAGHRKRNPVYELPKFKKNIDQSQIKYLVNNLDLLDKYSKEFGAIPIFINQKTLRGIKINKINYSISEFDILFYEKQIADIIKNYCIKNNINFINLFDEINFENKDFYDLVHTTPSGAKKIADFIYDKLNNRLIFD